MYKKVKIRHTRGEVDLHVDGRGRTLYKEKPKLIDLTESDKEEEEEEK